MKTVKMIFGSYGLPYNLPDGKRGVKLIDCGQTCEVEDAEADRLVALGVAAEVVATLQEAEALVEAGETTPEDSDALEGSEPPQESEADPEDEEDEDENEEEAEDDGELPPDVKAEAPVV